MTKVLSENRFRTWPTTYREGRAWQAALDAFATQRLPPAPSHTDSDSGRYFGHVSHHGSFATGTRLSEVSNVEVFVLVGEELPQETVSRCTKAVDVRADADELLVRERVDDETWPFPDLAELYISFFGAVGLLRPQPDPMPEDKERVDWEFMDSTPEPLRSGTLKARLRNVGPAKPRPDDNPWD